MNKEIIFTTIIILLLATTFFYAMAFYTTKKNTEIYKQILIVNNKLIIAYELAEKGNSYYDMAGISYENDDFNKVIINCEQARKYFLDYTQKVREIKAEINIEDDLLITYKKMLGYSISMYNNLYEACEHFESASRYYDKYYKSGTPYEDLSYERGTNEIKVMNEKIKEHDINVDKYNDLLAEFGVKLNKELGVK